ncbi:hypothetical protein [Lentzea sp. NBRC 102530]|uniref:hypothetical protein n=1 Tax=Lentzea sp. NBRC 102530 TaxID=3032201 RepID=UPI0025535416|nr:hypothetical protein [Lentzea sp. NBRC 102530]
MPILGEAVRTHWWRFAPVAAAAAVCVPTPGPSNLFGLVPIVLWCALARTRTTGLVVGGVLVVLLAAFVLPRAFWFAGPWVPSYAELFWLYPMLAALVCLPAVPRQRRVADGALVLAVMVLSGFLATGVLLVAQLEAKPGDEGVLPAPTGLTATEGLGHCGSGNCSREVTLTGDRAPERVREHLRSRGFTPRERLSPGDDRVCRIDGLLTTHEVCAESRTLTSTEVRVVWYVD